MTIKEIEEKTGKDVVMRSCWRCNSGHTHLKKVDYIIYCIWCDTLYLDGRELKIKELEEKEGKQ